MRKFYFIFILSWIVYPLLGQDMLTPMGYNPSLYHREHKGTLSIRSSEDSVNYRFNFLPRQLPFYDDFSKDNRIPRDINFLVTQVSYYTGPCETGKQQWMKLQDSVTYLYFWNTLTLAIDSIPNAPITIQVLDTPNCTTGSTLTLYPYTCRPEYDNVGNKIDSTCPLVDTNLRVAVYKSADLKDYFLWQDYYAYFNTHYPYMPYSKGVATLDGLNDKGRPYVPDVFDAYGRADVLTSVPIDLSPYSTMDSVYISFMYQPQGYGDWPDKRDSLVLEFRRQTDSADKWKPVWSAHGFTAPIKLDTLGFYFANIPIPGQTKISDPIYFYDSFQFRFTNYATLTGNNDHWHIDYVRLDTARTYNDTAINDLTFVYDLPSILKNYTLMPAKHFEASKDLRDTIIAYNRSIFPGNPSFLNGYNVECRNETTNTSYYSQSGVQFNTDILKKFDLEVQRNFNIPSTVNDGDIISTKIWISPSGDDFLTNDSAVHYQVFGKEMAYDDGTAEMAYGLQGLGVKKVAYKYKLSVQDTLAAIKILFSNIDVDVRTLIFNINIWKSISYDSGKTEILLKEISNKKPYYYDSLNKFYIFPLDTQLIVEDSIYVGWTQSDERNLQIGYDCNSTLGLPQTYIFANNVWSKSNVITPGSPMIRLLLDGNYKYTASIAETRKPSLNHQQIDVYPNPATNYIHIQNSSREKTNFSLYNLLGKQVLRQEYSREIEIDISHLPGGFYIATWEQEGSIISSQKLNISR